MAIHTSLIDDLDLDLDRPLKLPLGYRFAPTDQELSSYYLTKKQSHERVRDPVIRSIDAEEFYSKPPKDIVGNLDIGNTLRRDDEWFFFIHHHRNFKPFRGDEGRRRVVGDHIGSWRSGCGEQELIHDSDGNVVAVKTRFRYHDRSKKSNWWMEEYRLLMRNKGKKRDDEEEEWFVGRITKGKRALERQ